MARSADWLYHRKSCVTCKKARAFLQAHAIDVKSSADAGKDKRGRDDALKLARSMQIVHVARGKKLVTLDMSNDSPDDDTLASLLLGPTGNLRAPTLRKGNALYVGFSEEVYAALAT